ncbi:MAG: hypothetical protein SPL47_09045 [Bacteroidales bacterium]|nr:hypothetical protein [Bacteroidales bacterium]
MACCGTGKNGERKKMDLECSISVAVTLIAACTALVTGFQIINFCTINRRLHKIGKMQKETEAQLAIQRNVTQETICIFNGLEILNNGQDVLKKPATAFLLFHQALLYSIEIDREDYDWLFVYLNKCIEDLTYNDFEERGIVGGNQKKRVNEGIEAFKKDLVEVENNLKKSKNFVKIKSIYRQMRNSLDTKLDDIANLKQE